MKDNKTNLPAGQADEPKEKIKVALKPYTIKELAKIYGVCTKTFRRWINPIKKEIGERNGWFYSIAQVKIIFSELLLPSWIEVEQQKMGS